MKDVLRLGWATTLLVAFAVAPAPAQNLIQDPGFETYTGPDANGIYRPGQGSPWTEFGWGIDGFRQNRNNWPQPQELIDEGGLGNRTPATGIGFQGENLPNNRGTLAMQQNVTTGIIPGKTYEAWIWFAGNGGDVPCPTCLRDQLNEDVSVSFKFYSNANFTGLIDEDHSMGADYWGTNREFVRLSMRSRVPQGAVVMRVEIIASNHGFRVQNFPANAQTEVAIDNIYFGYLNEPNLIANPGFEQSVVTPNGRGFPDLGPWQDVNWTGWITPSELSGPLEQGGFDPQYKCNLPYRVGFGDYDNFTGVEPNLGNYTMCFFGEVTWGGISWFNGAFSMSQHVNWPGGTRALLSFYWLVVDDGPLQNNAAIFVTAQSRDSNGNKLGNDYTFYSDWRRVPMPNVDRDDNNSGPSNVRLLIPVAPNATRVDLHFRVQHTPNGQTPNVAVDDFYFAPLPEWSCVNDIDGDSVCDEQEHPNDNVPAGGSNRILSDSDGDGLSDGQEDRNKDGLLTGGETSTRNRDSDGDRFLDGLDANPLTADAGYTDADNDELHDPVDPNPASADSDSDRFKDGYERLYGNPTNATVKPFLGDLNADTFVTSLDALIAQSLFLQIINANNPVFDGQAFQDAFRFGDVNRDGFVTSLDALIIQSYFLQILAALPL